MSPVHVAIVGPDDPGASPDAVEWAETIGRGLAESGAVVVCGGLGGVMAAACRGAAGAGGTTIGLLPGLDRAEANPWVGVAVPTGLGEGRNLLVVRAADAVVAVGGAYGTLAEIALALKIGTPVVGLRTWELSSQGMADDGIHVVRSPAEAVDLALTLASTKRCGQFTGRRPGDRPKR